MPKKITIIKKGQFVYGNDIENFANENDYSTEYYGGNVIGENFIILKHNERDITITFILEGATSNQYVYECVYSDLK